MNGLTEVVQANISDVNQHLSTSLNSTMHGKGPDQIDRVFEQKRAMTFLGDLHTTKTKVAFAHFSVINGNKTDIKMHLLIFQ